MPPACRLLQCLMVRMTKSGRGQDGQPNLELPPLRRRQVLVYMHQQDWHQYVRLLRQQQSILMERKVEAALEVSDRLLCALACDHQKPVSCCDQATWIDAVNGHTHQ